VPLESCFIKSKINAPREDKNDWKLQKFHDMLHMKDIENFGSPNNVDSAPNENNLIDFATNTWKESSSEERIVVSQVSKRLRDLIL